MLWCFMRYLHMKYTHSKAQCKLEKHWSLDTYLGSCMAETRFLSHNNTAASNGDCFLCSPLWENVASKLHVTYWQMRKPVRFTPCVQCTATQPPESEQEIQEQMCTQEKKEKEKKQKLIHVQWLGDTTSLDANELYPDLHAPRKTQDATQRQSDQDQLHMQMVGHIKLVILETPHLLHLLLISWEESWTCTVRKWDKKPKLWDRNYWYSNWESTQATTGYIKSTTIIITIQWWLCSSKVTSGCHDMMAFKDFNGKNSYHTKVPHQAKTCLTALKKCHSFQWKQAEFHSPATYLYRRCLLARTLELVMTNWSRYMLNARNTCRQTIIQVATNTNTHKDPVKPAMVQAKLVTEHRYQCMCVSCTVGKPCTVQLKDKATMSDDESIMLSPLTDCFPPQLTRITTLLTSLYSSQLSYTMHSARACEGPTRWENAMPSYTRSSSLVTLDRWLL